MSPVCARIIPDAEWEGAQESERQEWVHLLIGPSVHRGISQISISAVMGADCPSKSNEPEE